MDIFFNGIASNHGGSWSLNVGSESDRGTVQNERLSVNNFDDFGIEIPQPGAYPLMLRQLVAKLD